MPSIAPKVEAAILRMLSKDSSKRFPSMISFMRALPGQSAATGSSRARRLLSCSACQQVNSFDSNFCQKCGKDLRRKCPTCDRLLLLADRFCRGCGAALSGALVKGKLTGLRGAFGGKQIILDKDIVTLGRHKDNDLSFSEGEDVYVSRYQARFYREKGQYWVEGWDWTRKAVTTNGTFLNGANVDGKGKLLLSDGDRLRFGDSFFRFEVIRNDRS